MIELVIEVVACNYFSIKEFSFIPTIFTND